MAGPALDRGVWDRVPRDFGTGFLWHWAEVPWPCPTHWVGRAVELSFSRGARAAPVPDGGIGDGGVQAVACRVNRRLGPVASASSAAFDSLRDRTLDGMFDGMFFDSLLSFSRGTAVAPLPEGGGTGRGVSGRAAIGRRDRTCCETARCIWRGDAAAQSERWEDARVGVRSWTVSIELQADDGVGGGVGLDGGSTSSRFAKNPHSRPKAS